jgi:hypothetical protein
MCEADKVIDGKLVCAMEEEMTDIKTVTCCPLCKQEVKIMGDVTQWYGNLDGSEHVCKKLDSDKLINDLRDLRQGIEEGIVADYQQNALDIIDRTIEYLSKEGK